MIYIIALLAALLLLVTIFIAGKFYFTNERRMTSETIGEVISADQETQTTNDRRLAVTNVVIRYRAGRRDFELRKTFPGERAAHFPVGRKIAVRYNPGTPEMAALNL